MLGAGATRGAMAQEMASFEQAMLELTRGDAAGADAAAAIGDGFDAVGAAAAAGSQIAEAAADLAADAKPKRIVKRRPPLNEILLCGERGVLDVYKRAPSVLGQLQSHKRKRCEAIDLERILGFYQAWHARFYPQLPYAQFVERVAHIGAKKKVHNFLSAARNDELAAKGLGPKRAGEEEGGAAADGEGQLGGDDVQQQQGEQHHQAQPLAQAGDALGAGPPPPDDIDGDDFEPPAPDDIEGRAPPDEDEDAMADMYFAGGDDEDDFF